jgi:hypothetical protein
MRRIKPWQIIVMLIAVLVIVGAVAFVIWGSNPLPADIQALSSLENDATVTVEQDPWLVFKPESTDPTGGLIIYPGGRVQPEAYVPAAHTIAEAGFLVVIPPMPLNLAVFGADVATDIMTAYPQIDCWVVGGHSLGGAMAARYAYNNPQSVQGLVLWAAYPADSNDLSTSNLAVVSIHASEDGLADIETIQASQPLLPISTNYVLIEGGNHAGFGWYGPQSGDKPRTISLESQQEQVIDATIALLDQACD